MEMKNQLFKEFKINNLVIKKPIVQGGMGIGISLSKLAVAVAREGGIGVISAIGAGLLSSGFQNYSQVANATALTSEITKAKKEANGGIIGVNIMYALSDFANLVRAALDARADIIFVGAGLLLAKPETISVSEFKKSNFIPIVSSARAVKVIFKSWIRRYNHVPNAVVVEGPEAGGHLGFKVEQLNDPDFSLDKISKEVLEVVKEYETLFQKKIPVIAGGGVYSGEDIGKLLDAGVSAVQMGSRFVATDECDAPDEFKKSYVDCRKEDISIIKSPLGLPGRAINSKFLKDVAKGKKQPISCGWKCIKHCDYRNAPYCIGAALLNSLKGKIEQGFAFCGAKTYKIQEIISVKELFSQLEQECFSYFNKPE